MKLTNEYGAGEEFMALSLEPASTPLNGGLVRMRLSSAWSLSRNDFAATLTDAG
jgi:hypothetical protein